MHNIRKEIDHLKVLIEQRIKHTYLARYVPSPVIDEEKLLVLHSILNHGSISAKKKKKYIITTMLVQIALDAHDHVSDAMETDDNPPETISRQLTVLAGDYYSGLYYLLLSEIDDFKLINKLASAIKRINELKMMLYFNEFTTLEEFIQLVKKVESLLFVYVAEFVDEITLIPLIEEWILTSKLVNEERMNPDVFSPLLDKWNVDSSILTKKAITEYIDSNIDRIYQELSRLPDNQFKLKAHITAFVTKYKKTSIAGDG